MFVGRLKARLAVSPQWRPVAKAQAMFFKGLKEVGDDESKVRVFGGKLRISFLLQEEMLLPNIHAVAKVTRVKVGLSTCT